MKRPLIVVLDDDPTGTQTIHDLFVYTNPSLSTIRKAFQENEYMFFLLTNSRSFSTDETIAYHKQLACTLHQVALEENRKIIIISRGDSTLRGYYPLETRCISDELMRLGEKDFDAELFIPCFFEGNRITEHDIHYVIQKGIKIPVAETEFAKDKSFGFRNSDLKKWIQEKSRGTISDSSIRSIDPVSQTEEQMRTLIQASHDHQYIIVNATNYNQLNTICEIIWEAIENGKRLIFRSAASFVCSIGSISSKPLLSRSDVIDDSVINGGLIVIGSHVQKTTKQLDMLRAEKDLLFLEFNQHRVFETNGLDDEVEKISKLINNSINCGKTVVVYTNRERVDSRTDNPNENLKLAVQISNAITKLVANLHVRPAFIIAKGGITSCEIGVHGLGVTRAKVIGQIEKGIPVWITGAESKFQDLPFIIFPGNVGNDDTLRVVVDKLK